MTTLSPHVKDGNTFIYLLRDPETCQVRYVGKADNPPKRLSIHLYQSTHLSDRHSHTHKANWLRSLVQRGLSPVLEIIESVPVQHWKEREIYWIAYYQEQGAPLTNFTLGGDGADGLVHSEEARRKISIASKGRKHTEEARRKLSVARKGNVVISEEQRQKMSIARKGKSGSPMSEETRRKIGDANRGKTRSEEDIHRNREWHTGRSPSESTRQKLREVNLGRTVSEESRARMREAAKQREDVKRQIRQQDGLWHDAKNE